MPRPASLNAAGRRGVRPQTYLLIYAVIAAMLILAHVPLLHLPYYWDELGQFIPASLDLFGHGQWIPHSTLPNVHPPGVMAWLGGAWRVSGYSIENTRIAMLLMASAGAVFTFLLAIELSRHAPGTPAFAALGLLTISPLFFAQSMLAQLDMPAMCFSVLALLLFLRNRFRPCALVCVALVLTKETGIVAPALFGMWLLLERRVREALWFLLPLVALLGWLAVLKHGTGHWMGNRQFTDYNLLYPLHPGRFSLALMRRLYYLFAGSGHIIGTVALCVALPRLLFFRDRAWRIAAAFIAVHVLAVCALGGAVLERYLLPVLPVVYIAFAIALASRRIWLAALAACLALANFINPIYPFPFENNLAFVAFVETQMEAASAADGHPGIIATAFPMTDALRRPEAGYVTTKREVITLEGFRRKDIDPLIAKRPDILIVFDTIWDPLRLLSRAPLADLMTRLYGYEPPLTPDQIAGITGLRVHRRWTNRGLSAALLVR